MSCHTTPQVWELVIQVFLFFALNIIVFTGVKFSTPSCSVCVFRYEIEEGLRRLRDVKPAGETYMHEGIKEVISQFTSLKLFKPTFSLL